jgi:hypothetical protein
MIKLVIAETMTTLLDGHFQPVNRLNVREKHQAGN